MKGSATLEGRPRPGRSGHRPRRGRRVGLGSAHACRLGPAAPTGRGLPRQGPGAHRADAALRAPADGRASACPWPRTCTLPVSLPVFDNSGMDGYAVSFRTSPTRPASGPCTCRSSARSPPGQTTDLHADPRHRRQDHDRRAGPRGVHRGGAVRVDRGVGPRGARAPGARRRASTSASPARRCKKGDLLMRRGEVIGTRQVGLLAAIGLGRVPTSPRPRVVVMSTGSELVEPGRPAGPRQHLRRQQLPARGRGPGPRRHRLPGRSPAPTTPPPSTESLSDQLVRADMVVTSGGVSKGTHDVVKEVLSELGTVDFLEVAMQPGQAAGVRRRRRGPAPRSSRCRATRCRRTSRSRCSWCPRCTSSPGASRSDGA